MNANQHLQAAPVVQGEPVGLSRFIEMIEARASIRKSGMIDGIILLRDLKAMLAAAPSTPQQVSTHWSHDNPGLADQYRAEALAARRTLGFEQDACDVAPTDISAAIESLTRTAAPAVQMEVVGWQFYQDGKWWDGDDSIKDHKRNTQEAGYRIRDVYAVPQSADVRLDKQCRQDVAAALGLSSGGNYAWTYLLQQIKDVSGLVESLDMAELHKLLMILRSTIGGAMWTLDDEEEELAVRTEKAIAALATYLNQGDES